MTGTTRLWLVAKTNPVIEWVETRGKRVKDEMVRIEWYDAKFCPGMHSVEDATSHVMDKFESIGYLILQDDRTTILAFERNDSGEYRDILLIPSGSILTVKPLTLVSTM